MLGVVQERAAALFCEEWLEGRGLGQVCSGVSRTWLPLLCEVAPLNKEPEESQKEQAVSQQLRENGATPTGGQARRRNGPASMAASYLNIAQLLGKARGEAQWRRRAGLRSPKPVCNSKEMLFLPQTGCVAAQHWDSVICQWNPAAGGASSKSCLPLVCVRSALSGELPKCLDRGDPILLFTAPLLFPLPSLPQALEARRDGKCDVWACTADLARCCHHHGFLQAQAQYFGIRCCFCLFWTNFSHTKNPETLSKIKIINCIAQQKSLLDLILGIASAIQFGR